MFSIIKENPFSSLWVLVLVTGFLVLMFVDDYRFITGPVFLVLLFLSWLYGRGNQNYERVE